MKLETSVELLERVRAKHGSSWYGLGRLLEVHENTITNWKGGRTIVDRKFAPRLAALLDEPAEYVLLCLEHERETSPEMRKIWKRLAAMITHNAASILLGTAVVLGLAALPAQRVAAAPAEGATPGMYIKSNRRRSWWSRFGRWLGTPLCGRLTPLLTGRIVTAAAI